MPWIPPAAGYFKLNIDGSAQHDDIAAGGVLRDEQGHWITGFLKFLGKGYILLAETLSLYIGLKIAIDCKRKKLEIETDSEELFGLISKSNIENHPLSVLICNCRLLLSLLEGFKLFRIHISQNSCVDIMAKIGRLCRVPLRLFIQTPAFVQNEYAKDLNHMLFWVSMES